MERIRRMYCSGMSGTMAPWVGNDHNELRTAYAENEIRGWYNG